MNSYLPFGRPLFRSSSRHTLSLKRPCFCSTHLPNCSLAGGPPTCRGSASSAVLGVVVSVAVTVTQWDVSSYLAVGSRIGSQPAPALNHQIVLAPSNSQSLYSILVKLAPALWKIWK